MDIRRQVDIYYEVWYFTTEWNRELQREIYIQRDYTLL